MRSARDNHTQVKTDISGCLYSTRQIRLRSGRHPQIGAARTRATIGEHNLVGIVEQRTETVEVRAGKIHGVHRVTHE